MAHVLHTPAPTCTHAPTSRGWAAGLDRVWAWVLRLGSNRFGLGFGGMGFAIGLGSKAKRPVSNGFWVKGPRLESPAQSKGSWGLTKKGFGFRVKRVGLRV
ncbi:hypothetical protein ACFX1W_036233 [Malus domestica]